MHLNTSRQQEKQTGHVPRLPHCRLSLTRACPSALLTGCTPATTNGEPGPKSDLSNPEPASPWTSLYTRRIPPVRTYATPWTGL